MLRHALVKVSMGPGQKNSQEQVEKDKVEEELFQSLITLRIIKLFYEY